MFELKGLVLKLILALLVFISASGAGIYYLYQTVVISKSSQSETENVPVYGLTENRPANNGGVAIVPIKKGGVTRQVSSLGGPLLVDFPTETDFTTLVNSTGVVFLTNQERSLMGLAPLSLNHKLNLIAELKLNDMVNLQYFAHISPTGKGIGQFASESAYNYAVIGENLAMGHFADDTALVLAWMESPGHRENILNQSYREIGVATRVVTFEGKSVLLAVQVFGKPLASCTLPNKALHNQIITNQAELTQIKSDLTKLESELADKDSNKKDQSELIKSYNELVASFNNLNKVTEASIIAYNQEVNKYNYCVSN